MTQSITYRNVGMSVQVKPEVGANGDITLDLHIENSRMRTPEGGVSVGTDEKGKALPAAEFINSTLQTRLKLRPGQIAVAEDTKAASKTGQGQTIILVSASTEQGGAKSGK
jgi:type II secretory pathway component GspD/PulD (secretin)